ncbi:MAG: phosphatase, partial [Clostridia bacterium]|nr:phosphatase [Clostridia bacterium]
EAVSAIRKGGGVPVLAHPAYGSGEEIILGETMTSRLSRLTDMGLEGIEAYYSGFTGKIRSEMLALAERFGLYVTAGSDYHGSNKLVMLGDTGLEKSQQLPEGLKKFIARVIPEAE